jgi:aminoglycoside phosphotransferase (APT) family kinase protein
MDRSAPSWVASALGGGIAEAARLAWGFTNESWVATARDGRRLVATRLADPAAAEPLRVRTALARPRLAKVGLPVPAVLETPGGSTTPDDADGRILVSEFVEGRPGPEVLGEPGGPALVGRLLGEAWRRLAGVDPSGLGLPARWASPDELASAARAWAVASAPRLSRSARAQLNARLADLPSLLARRATGLVHGDLVPANVLVRGRDLAALLDLEAMRIADPLLDAGWFDWIVWFHHPADEPAAWEAFSEAGGAGERDETAMALVSLLPAIRLLEILADRTLASAASGRWLEQLVACLDRPPRARAAGG